MNSKNNTNHRNGRVHKSVSIQNLLTIFSSPRYFRGKMSKYYLGSLSVCTTTLTLACILFGFTANVDAIVECPNKCRCFFSTVSGSNSIERVDCSGAGLTRIPMELPSTVKILDLRKNFIDSIHSSQLESLASVHTVWLSDNRIRHLEEYILDKLPQLRRLNLARNHLIKLPRLSLSGSSFLQTLDLHANNLRSLNAHTFSGLRYLEHLNLAKNSLQNLPENIFSDNFVIYSLHLEHNPWNCDCRISPTVELLSSRRNLEVNSRHNHSHNSFFAKCQNPGQLRSKMIHDLKKSDLMCHPAVINKLSNSDNAYLLNCQLPSNFSIFLRPSSDNIEWLYKDKSITTNFLNEFETLENGSLIVHDALRFHLQDFQCAQNFLVRPLRYARETNTTQRNSHYYVNNNNDNSQHTKYGKFRVESTLQRKNAEKSTRFNDYSVYNQGSSFTAKDLQLEGISAPEIHSSPPRFTYVIRDRSYREGSIVKLNCEVTGRPRPKITWRFSGNHNKAIRDSDHIIEASRKFQFYNDNSELHIYPFLEHDVGRYSCEAENEYGRIEAHASIGLVRSQPPMIVEGPQSMIVYIGKPVVFKCKAHGEPRPSITWFFDGSEISSTQNNKHYQISDDGSELIIDHVTHPDQGTYSCMAGNSVGSMTSDAKLHIQSSQLDLLHTKLNAEFLKGIVEEASQNVDRAIVETKKDLKSNGVLTPQELLRHFKFTTKRPTELTKAREIYEESLRLLEKHVETGLNLQPLDMPTNVSYESVLSVTHIQTIMELSGCMNGQFKESCNDMCFHSKYRSYTGQCNNFDHPTWGVSQMPFYRLLPPAYENGFNTPVGWDPTRLYFGYPKPNPRTISMELVGTEEITPHFKFSAMLMQWGQFIDHDLDFTATALARQTYVGGAICNRTCENIDPCFNIPLPLNDPRRKPGMKFPCIEFERSAAICGSGETSPIFHQVTYREQTNTVTSFIDASNVYGSTEVDALDLRDLYRDHGLLRFDIVSDQHKQYMPFEKDSAMDCRRNQSVDNPIRCFLSGDVRANEQLGLTSMHTIWFREHNRIASRLLEMNGDWDGERIYQEARKIVGAMLQHITYSHWLPKVLSKDGYDALIGAYTGYNSEVNPLVSNAFATAAFRFGHTLINPFLNRFNENFESIPSGPLKLHDAFFAPERLLSEGGIDPILRGLFATPMKLPKANQLLNKELTERLFNRAHDVSLDLAVMNLQRGRDHGLPGYLEYRKFCNLTVPTSWEELAIDIKDDTVLKKLQKLYGHPGNIDLFVGGIVERRLSGALVGPTFSCIIADQFRRVRNGDRFWYENPGVFTPLQLNQIKKTSLAKVLCNNGDSIDRVQSDVFLFVDHTNSSIKVRYNKCSDHPDMDLRMWMSCCDSACSSHNDESADSNSRVRRRVRHLYGTPPTAANEKGNKITESNAQKAKSISTPFTPQKTVNIGDCEHQNMKKLNGDIWNSGKCTVCKCQDGLVWCNQKNGCLDDSSNLP